MMSGDTFLRERDDGVIPEKPPEPDTYSDWAGTAPVIRIPRPAYSTDKDGNVVVRDTRPAQISVDTADDGAVILRVPV